VALTVIPLPYGLRDVKVCTLDATGTKGTLVDLPNSQTYEFEENTSTQELRGDDSVVAKRTTVDAVAWTLEAGGISLEACVVMFGGTITSSGTTPAQKKVYRRLATDAYPDFFVEGQSLSESGGDVHTVIYRNKAEKFSGSHTDQEFWVTHAEGTGIGSLAAANLNAVWDHVQNETAATIV
jgi:hypothetical protein